MRDSERKREMYMYSKWRLIFMLKKWGSGATSFMNLNIKKKNNSMYLKLSPRCIFIKRGGNGESKSKREREREGREEGGERGGIWRGSCTVDYNLSH